MQTRLTRRDVLAGLTAGTLAASLLRLAFASPQTRARFVLVLLRGAVDGLALCPPYGDNAYRDVRGELAIDLPGSREGAKKLDGLFGLHPSLANIHAAFERSEAAVVHAVASPYRDRSHFDGQDLLETGGGRTGQLRDGWLNRALAPMGSALGQETAIALGQTAPLVLRGEQSVTSWAPSRLRDANEETLARLADLYASDEFFAMRLEQAIRSQDIAADMTTGSRRPQRNNRALAETMTHAARFLTADDGPRIAVVESGGWDTHANQGGASGPLANRFGQLDDALESLRAGLHDAWQHTVVAVVTEFGRTVRVNGTRGTDHGTGTVALFLGGAVRGGQVFADWPGLARRNLYEGRDLAPTIDLRSPLKTILVSHLGLDAAFVESVVFPGSGGVVPLGDLVQSSASAKRA